MAENLEQYEAVLRDLKSERGELDKLIAAMESRVAVKRRALGSPNTPQESKPLQETKDSPQSTTEPMTPLTIYEGCEQVLEKAGEPLHVKVLVVELDALGKKTTGDSISGALPQDTQKRFYKAAPATFGLTKWRKSEES